MKEKAHCYSCGLGIEIGLLSSSTKINNRWYCEYCAPFVELSKQLTEMDEHKRLFCSTLIGYFSKIVSIKNANLHNKPFIDFVLNFSKEHAKNLGPIKLFSDIDVISLYEDYKTFAKFDISCEIPLLWINSQFVVTNRYIYSQLYTASNPVKCWFMEVFSSTYDCMQTPLEGIKTAKFKTFVLSEYVRIHINHILVGMIHFDNIFNSSTHARLFCLFGNTMVEKRSELFDNYYDGNIESILTETSEALGERLSYQEWEALRNMNNDKYNSICDIYKNKKLQNIDFYQRIGDIIHEIDLLNKSINESRLNTGFLLNELTDRWQKKMANKELTKIPKMLKYLAKIRDDFSNKLDIVNECGAGIAYSFFSGHICVGMPDRLFYKITRRYDHKETKSSSHGVITKLYYGKKVGPRGGVSYTGEVTIKDGLVAKWKGL